MGYIMSDKNEAEQVELTQEQLQAQLKEQSSQVGQNMQAFMSQVQLSAKTEEDRRVLNVYSNVMEVVEKIVSGDVIIISAASLLPPVESDDE